MIAEQWQPGLLIGVFAVHLLAVTLAYRRRGRDAPGATPEGDPVDREEGVVRRPACATENEPGYRFCRSCVAELPMSMSFGGAGTDPLGRIAR
jgi:hypothetical protein